MPRIRYLKPEFFSDEDLAEFPFQTRLTFAGLWCWADKSGRLEDRPKFLKCQIFPYDDVDMEGELQKLCQFKISGQPFIHRYETDGQRYISIPCWDKHQRPHHTEKNSVIPEPPKLTPIPPLTTKGMEKGMEKQLNPSRELNNGGITVKKSKRSKIKVNKDILYSEEFLKFWNMYPTRNGTKPGKKEASEAWKQLNPDEKLGKIILDSLKKQINHYQDCKDHGEFIAEFKDAFRWLDKKKWEDEVKTKDWKDRVAEEGETWQPPADL